MSTLKEEDLTVLNCAKCWCVLHGPKQRKRMEARRVSLVYRTKEGRIRPVPPSVFGRINDRPVCVRCAHSEDLKRCNVVRT